MEWRGRGDADTGKQGRARKDLQTKDSLPKTENTRTKWSHDMSNDCQICISFTKMNCDFLHAAALFANLALAFDVDGPPRVQTHIRQLPVKHSRENTAQRL